MASLKGFFEGMNEIGATALGKKDVNGVFEEHERPFAITICILILVALAIVVSLMVLMLSSTIGMIILGIMVSVTAMVILWIRFLDWFGRFGYKACEKAEKLKKLADSQNSE